MTYSNFFKNDPKENLQRYIEEKLVYREPSGLSNDAKDIFRGSLAGELQEDIL